MIDKQLEAEQRKEKKSKETKEVKPAQKKPEEDKYEALIRVSGYDIPSSRTVYAGLTKIKGISWALSNALCIKLNLDRNKRFSELSKDDLKRIETALAAIDVFPYQKNRQKDPETGVTEHLLGSDLDIAREFDIKRLKKIKSYKGQRHSYRLPVRGQRTRSHFRARGGSVQVRRKKAAAA